MENYRRHQKFCFENFRKLHKAGVPIALGTDLNVQPNMGENALELETYVELGMSPMDAIIAGTTRSAADAIGMGREIGTLEKGKTVDVIAVRGNPLDDIRLFRQRADVELVMRGGEIWSAAIAGS